MNVVENENENMLDMVEIEDEASVSGAGVARVGGRRKRDLTRMQLGILGFITSKQAPGGEGAFLTKKEIAEAVGCGVKTVERAIVCLRAKGLVEVVPRHDEAGAQLGNTYRIAR